MKIEKIEIKNLMPADYNPRKISKEALDGLTASLNRFGCVQPIIWNQKTKNIVGGHQRLKALSSLGVKEAFCVIVDLDLTDEKALNIALNNEKIQGDWDELKLSEILSELKISFDGFDELLFSSIEISIEENSPIEEKDFDPNDDFLEKNQEKWKVSPGQIWKLGESLLLCGDSTLEPEMKKFIGDNKPILCVTDPPYGVNYNPSWRVNVGKSIGKHTLGKVKNDNNPKWTEVYKNIQADVIYCWHAAKFAVEVCQNLEEAGYQIVNQIIWAKQHFVLSRGDYHWQHEPCWYAVKKGKKHNWQGKRDQSTLWEINNNNSFGNSVGKEIIFGHGTQKPLQCMEIPILNNSCEGEWIIDPFSGSGTTLIAAEKNKRKCLAVEIDEKYCSATLERFSVEFPNLKCEKV